MGDPFLDNCNSYLVGHILRIIMKTFFPRSIYIIKIQDCLLQLHVKRLNVVVIREQVSQWAQHIKIVQ